MGRKELIKPTIGKVILFIILILLTIFIPKTTQFCIMAPGGVVCGQTDAKGIGYPIFYGTMYLGDVGTIGLYPLNLLINIIIYYVLSCVVISLYYKIKSR